MQIGGSVNTQAIETGLTRVETGLKNVGAAGDSVNSDFIRINNQAKSLGKRLGIIATVGTAAMVGLSKGAPAVAGAMAKIKISAGKLKRTLGTALKPAFERVSEEFGKFVGWVQDKGPIISEFAVNTIDSLSTSVKVLGGLWKDFASIKIPFLDVTIGEGLKSMLTNFGGEAIGALIGGKLGGPAGAVIGAGAVSLATGFAEKDLTIAGFAGLGAGIGTAIAPGVGTLVGLGLGAIIGKGVSLFLSRNDRKANSLELEYSI